MILQLIGGNIKPLPPLEESKELIIQQQQRRTLLGAFTKCCTMTWFSNFIYCFFSYTNEWCRDAMAAASTAHTQTFNHVVVFFSLCIRRIFIR